MTKFTLAFVLVDLGDDKAAQYKTMCSEMIRSAKRAFADHEMTLVQITDNRGINHPDADRIFALDTKCEAERICQFKGWMIAEFALKNQTEPIIFCDVDLVWNNDRALRHLEEHPRSLHVLNRAWACMPFNSGLIMSQGCVDFWQDYQDIIGSYPDNLQGWYCDQLALVTAVYKQTEAYPVYFLDMDKIAPAIDVLPDGPLNSPCVHFKGPRKDLMMEYARMLGGSKEWVEGMRPIVPKQPNMPVGARPGGWDAQTPEPLPGWHL